MIMGTIVFILLIVVFVFAIKGMSDEPAQNAQSQQKPQQTVSTIVDSEIVNECMRIMAVMLGLVQKNELIEGRHRGGFFMCSCQYEGIVLETYITSNEDWIYAVQHYDDVFIENSITGNLTWGAWFELNPCASALKWAKEHESTLSEVDSFQQIGIKYHLDSSSERLSLLFEKTIPVPGDVWLYFQAIKEKAAEKYPKHFEFQEKYNNLFNLNFVRE